MTPAATVGSAATLAHLSERIADAAQLVPLDGLVAGPADSQSDLTELLPANDAVVLTVPGRSSEGEITLVIIVRADLMAAMNLADPSALAERMEPVIGYLAGDDEVAVAQHQVALGAMGLAGLPVSGAAANELLVAAGLFLGTDHVATLGIGLRAGAAEEAPVVPIEAVDLPDIATARPTPVAATAAIGTAAGTADTRSLHMLRNVEMNVTAELGRCRMTVADLLSLTPGSVVELDRAAGSPIDLLVNGTLIARGEVVVIDEEFGLRISEIVDRGEGA